jgi:hypothetical protein
MLSDVSQKRTFHASWFLATPRWRMRHAATLRRVATMFHFAPMADTAERR